MTFERARSEKQKNERIEQIKVATLKEYEHKGYHNISLSSIAKELNFTRANLYRYISSKEDIFLKIIIDEINLWIDDLEKRTMNVSVNDIHTFSKEWVNSLLSNKRHLELLSLLATVIEQNATLDNLITFKNQLANSNKRLVSIIKIKFPCLSEEDIFKFLTYYVAMATGLNPICHPTKKQIEAMHGSDYPAVIPEFEDMILNFLKDTLSRFLNQK
jgi:AcrR family transcriptional regulator